MRSIFGWSLPPGCSMRDIERAQGSEGPCVCCGESEEKCICIECPTCSAIGDPKCYKEHGLTYTEAQLQGQKELAERIEADAKADREMADAQAAEWQWQKDHA